MSPKLYKIYRRTWYFKEKIRRKLTPAGRFLFIIVVASAFLGMNTQKTMIYQLFALSSSLLIVALLASLRFTSNLTIKRLLPETCTAGMRLTYRLQIKNHGQRIVKGLFVKEELQDPLPTYEEFASTPEDGEEKRNRFDRWAGYYRWMWIIRKNKGAEVGHHPLPVVHGQEQVEVHVHLTPFRRGYIHLQGYSICRYDPFGLVKSNVRRHKAQNLLVLPKIYSLSSFQFNGSRKHQQGGIAAALKIGDSPEFVALREYRHGDPVKHIDWKSSARTGNTVVREFQDEYFSRYGLVLDTFSPRSHSDVFEEAVSVAASILTASSMSETVLDLMFVGPDHFIATGGQGIAEQHHMLEILASVTTCRDKSFTELSALLKSHVAVLSGFAIILIDLDSERKELLDYLSTMQVPFKAMLVVADQKEGQAKIVASGCHTPITILEVGQIAEGLATL